MWMFWLQFCAVRGSEAGAAIFVEDSLCEADEIVMVCVDVGQLDVNQQHHLQRHTDVSIYEDTAGQL